MNYDFWHNVVGKGVLNVPTFRHARTLLRQDYPGIGQMASVESRTCDVIDVLSSCIELFDILKHNFGHMYIVL